jgi:hypothetical protein
MDRPLRPGEARQQTMSEMVQTMQQGSPSLVEPAAGGRQPQDGPDIVTLKDQPSEPVKDQPAKKSEKEEKRYND